MRSELLEHRQLLWHPELLGNPIRATAGSSRWAMEPSALPPPHQIAWSVQALLLSTHILLFFSIHYI